MTDSLFVIFVVGIPLSLLFALNLLTRRKHR